MKPPRLEDLRRLTAGGTDHDHPVFSPDGGWIVFAAGPYRAGDLYLMDRRGRFARRVTDGPGGKSHPCFAPDGARIAYCVQAGAAIPGEFGHPDPPCEIVALDLAPEARPVKLAGDGKARYKQPAFSPDGRRLAYFADEGTPDNFHLFILDLETGERRQVTAEPNRNDCHPAWAPDGRRLAFHAYEGRESDRANIYAVDSVDGVVSRLTDRPGLSKHPCFADDRWIVFHREEPAEEPALHAVDAERGREARLSPGCGKQPHVGRTRKGRWKVAFASRQRPGEVFDIHVASLEGLRAE